MDTDPPKRQRYPRTQDPGEASDRIRGEAKRNPHPATQRHPGGYKVTNLIITTGSNKQPIWEDEGPGAITTGSITATYMGAGKRRYTMDTADQRGQM